MFYHYLHLLTASSLVSDYGPPRHHMPRCLPKIVDQTPAAKCCDSKAGVDANTHIHDISRLYVTCINRKGGEGGGERGKKKVKGEETAMTVPILMQYNEIYCRDTHRHRDVGVKLKPFS
ncbi:unnamed protein product [Hydatigera taeniaeformis]|uniref:Secreted protein n=1 Tax=Hydatigena taeniaeformis TaxID=6205 RepID=A0A0R3WIL7_HYDTA|nr:unnamed protein product [Hydatigera taeniaeformis]